MRGVAPGLVGPRGRVAWTTRRRHPNSHPRPLPAPDFRTSGLPDRRTAGPPDRRTAGSGRIRTDGGGGASLRVHRRLRRSTPHRSTTPCRGGVDPNRRGRSSDFGRAFRIGLPTPSGQWLTRIRAWIVGRRAPGRSRRGVRLPARSARHGGASAAEFHRLPSSRSSRRPGHDPGEPRTRGAYTGGPRVRVR